MKRRQMTRITLALAIVTLSLLGACSSQGTETANTNQTAEAQGQQAILTASHNLTAAASTPSPSPPQPTDTPAPAPTNTARPTDTPAPTSTDTPEPTPTWTQTSITTATPSPEPPGPPPLTESDPQSVVEYVVYLMHYQEYGLIDNVVGDYGAHYLPPYGGEFTFPGYDNGAEIAQNLAEAFQGSSPVCLGIGSAADKEILYFDGFPHDQIYSTVINIIVMRQGSRYLVVAIGHLPEEGAAYTLENLAPCPELAGQ